MRWRSGWVTVRWGGQCPSFFPWFSADGAALGCEVSQTLLFTGMSLSGVVLPPQKDQWVYFVDLAIVRRVLCHLSGGGWHVYSPASSGPVVTSWESASLLPVLPGDFCLYIDNDSCINGIILLEASFSLQIFKGLPPIQRLGSTTFVSTQMSPLKVLQLGGTVIPGVGHMSHTPATRSLLTKSFRSCEGSTTPYTRQRRGKGFDSLIDCWDTHFLFLNPNLAISLTLSVCSGHGKQALMLLRLRLCFCFESLCMRDVLANIWWAFKMRKGGISSYGPPSQALGFWSQAQLCPFSLSSLHTLSPFLLPLHESLPQSWCWRTSPLPSRASAWEMSLKPRISHALKHSPSTPRRSQQTIWI